MSVPVFARATRGPADPGLIGGTVNCQRKSYVLGAFCLAALVRGWENRLRLRARRHRCRTAPAGSGVPMDLSSARELKTFLGKTLLASLAQPGEAARKFALASPPLERM